MRELKNNGEALLFAASPGVGPKIIFWVWCTTVGWLSEKWYNI